jgi:hypothetical protein
MRPCESARTKCKMYKAYTNDTPFEQPIQSCRCWCRPVAQELPPPAAQGSHRNIIFPRLTPFWTLSNKHKGN